VLDSAVIQDLHAIRAEPVYSLLKFTFEQDIKAVSNQAIKNTEEVELDCLTLVRGSTASAVRLDTVEVTD